MDGSNRSKVLSKLILTATLSGALTIGLATIHSVLCILALVYRFKCDVGVASEEVGSNFYINTIYRAYIQKNSCGNSDLELAEVNIMGPDTVFILVCATLITCVCSCGAAIVLIIVVADEKRNRYIHATACVYICAYGVSVVADVTSAVFFVIDFSNVANVMDNSLAGDPSNYKLDAIRLGASLLMSISMKGFVAHVTNIALLILLAVYITLCRDKLQQEEHSIHKMGALSAYEHQKAQEDVWQQGGQMNPAYMEDDEPRRSPRSPIRKLSPVPMSDTSIRGYDRSNSWHHSQSNSQPFSYLEEVQRSAPKASPLPSPRSEPQWRRNPWPPTSSAPPMPAPDYSPPPRRLKSALKPNYVER